MRRLIAVGLLFICPLLARNRAPLQRNAFDPLPLGAVKPRGWLRGQLEIQAKGLTGHLDEFWNDVGPNSGWLGGTGESWERGPYYLDGLLPLAYELDDSALKAKAQKWVDWALNSQRSDGQFGPANNDDWWPRMVMLKVLTQYQEATGDRRVIPLMAKYFEYELRELPGRPLRDWGKYRWQDNVYTALWLYNRTGDPKLLDLTRILHGQGYDWQGQFARFPFEGKQTAAGLGLVKGVTNTERAMQSHGVNNAMALKASPVWWLISGKPEDKAAFGRQLAALDRYHGLPNGMFSGDEHFAGPDPSQGIELCAVVEAMFSLEEDFGILGDSTLGDRLERIAYNALPATLSNDMWSHQYDQQPNQIACTRAHRQWSTNGNDSNLFGLEPHFGCCTANLHQGWPKLVSNLWMGTPDGGLVAVAYGPSEVATKIDGAKVTVAEETEYPFRGEVKFTITVAAPTVFTLQLRRPGWAANAVLSRAAEFRDGFYSIRRRWQNGDAVMVKFPNEPRVSHWYREAAVFERGPLVFSLPLETKWSELKRYAEKSADWQLTSETPWNYAVQIGPCATSVEEHDVGQTPFDSGKAAVTLAVTGRRLPDWREQENSAGPVPESPVGGTGKAEDLTLIPYGAAKLRVTAFPFLKERSQCGDAGDRAR